MYRSFIIYSAIILGLSGITSEITHAKSFRHFTPIASKQAELNQQQGVAAQASVSPQAVEHAVGQLLEAWNNGTLDKKLSDEFFDASRLLDTLETEVPRDARLRLLSLRQTRTLSQSVEQDPVYGKVLVSKVSAVALTQLEFNRQDSGEFVNLEGENEFLMSIKQRIQP